jgi:hypothetical protein
LERASEQKQTAARFSHGLLCRRKVADETAKLVVRQTQCVRHSLCREEGSMVGDRGDVDLRGTALGIAYERACKSFEAITEFRAKLLALLPLATGTGAFLLLERQETNPDVRQLLGPIGLLGVVVTAGLFAYELRGMQRCTRLEVQASRIEHRLGLSAAGGPFKGQPGRSLWGMLGPPAAGLIVYLATAFTWLFIAGFGLSWWKDPRDAWWLLPLYPVVLAVAGVLLWVWLERAAKGRP